jgi:hypothetical protein
MKKIPNLALLLTIALFSCKDGKSPEDTTTFMNIKAGSTWNYETSNNLLPGATSTYTLTSTNRDTVANGNTYHVYTNSATNASEYYRVSGNDYYTFQKLPAELGGSLIENLYLKTNVSTGVNWIQNFMVSVPGIPFPLPVTITNTILEKGISKTVNGSTYNNVIHTSTGIAVSGIPPASLTTDIHNYYAPNVGMVENSNKININFPPAVGNTDNTTKLKTAVLK